MCEHVKWLEDCTIHDLAVVGGKNASLGEMIRELGLKGVRVPGGFCTTSTAYRYYIKANGLEERLRVLFTDLDVNDNANLSERGLKARELLLSTPFPADLAEAIKERYLEMCTRYASKGQDVVEIDVAVRSSATAEDLPHASFAGQQETYLNICGVESVLEACLKCYASLFTDRAIAYRAHHGFDHLDVALAVGIQKMVRSDLAAAGVIFSIDTETGFKDAIIVTSSYGLGEMVVQGSVNPDEFIVFKTTLRQGFKSLISSKLGTKEVKMIYSEDGRKSTEIVSTEVDERKVFSLSREDVLALAEWTVIIEDHYSAVHGKPTPMDVEWAKDGQTGELFVVQARPETVQSRAEVNMLRKYRLLEEGMVIAHGKAVGARIGSGKACVIESVKDIAKFRAGDVLVTDRTDPDWEPIMKKASAIVTNQGGRTCHAAIISRELGVPATVGCGDATDKIRDGQDITVCCAQGEVGRIYEGKLKFDILETRLDVLPETKTKIMMNVGSPDEAFALSAIPNSGVGLARLEFIIANHIKVHPLALLRFEELESKEEKEEIEKLTFGYEKKSDYFVDMLASGIAMIGAAFYPKDVVVRLSDFKSNEYFRLLGGSCFEPHEENPMIGWRGASRYYDPNFIDAFALECQALKRVSDEMGITNVIAMIPFCRTPEEGKKVISIMESYGLKQGVNGFQCYVMCEVPSNVVLADEFCEIFDGFSIGSNDLTQLLLGLDRDSALVAHLFDERNAAVMKMIEKVIKECKSRSTKIGICGQAPSDYPEFARFLVRCGIDSISLNPDTVFSTMLDIVEMEKQLKQDLSQ